MRLNGHVTKIQDGDLAEVFSLRTFSCFYRAKRSVARYCHGKLSDHLSVCLCVFNVEVSWSYRLEFCENNFTARLA